MEKETIKKALLIFACGVAVGMILSGCASTEPDRYVVRNCPVKRVYGEEADRVVKEKIYYDGKHVFTVGNCWRDAQSIAKWCDSQGIEYKEQAVSVKYGKRTIRNGHVNLVINNSTIEYIDGLGVVRKKEYKESKK